MVVLFEPDIVTGKPTNKVEQFTAEPVEPRAEAEGNASQQSTCRAQDRESVGGSACADARASRERLVGSEGVAMDNTNGGTCWRNAWSQSI